MTRVLFVCMGNICRSPTAEGVLRAAAEARGLDGAIDVDSAGTISYHAGEPPDARMRAAAAARGYQLGGRSRPVTRDDFETFDWIVAMDRDNLRDLEDAADGGSARLVLFSRFLPNGRPTDVPDPYYGGADGFEVVLDLVEVGCEGLLDEIVAE